MHRTLKATIVGAVCLAGAVLASAEAQAMPFHNLSQDAASPASIDKVWYRYGGGWRRPYYGYGWGGRRPFYGYRYGWGWRRPYWGWRRW